MSSVYGTSVADWRRAIYEYGNLSHQRQPSGDYVAIGGVKALADLYNYLADNHAEIQKKIGGPHAEMF